VDPRAEVAEHGARVVDDHDGNTGGLCDVRTRGIRDDRHRPLSGGRGGELGAVPVHAPDGDEGLARAKVCGGEGDSGELDAREITAGVAAEAVGELGQRTTGWVGGAEHGGQGSHVESMFSRAAEVSGTAPDTSAVPSQRRRYAPIARTSAAMLT